MVHLVTPGQDTGPSGYPSIGHSSQFGYPRIEHFGPSGYPRVGGTFMSVFEMPTRVISRRMRTNVLELCSPERSE